MAATISQSSAGATTIQTLVERLFRHVREIQGAPGQQAMASRQAVAAIEDLRAIAQQSADGGLGVRDAARHLETIIHDLTADMGETAETAHNETRL